MSEPQDTGASAPPPAKSPPDPQQHIAGLRAKLLAGRGPRASQAELDAHQHQRVDFGGLPVTVAREQFALVTSKASAAPVGEAQTNAANRLAQLSANAPPPPQGRPEPGSGEPPGFDAIRDARREPSIAYAFALGALLGFAIARSRRR